MKKQKCFKRVTASDLIFNTSGTNDGAVNTIALGEAASCYSKYLNAALLSTE